MPNNKILVIDDSAVIRLQVKNVLSGAGFEIVEAKDGAEGLQNLTAQEGLAAVVCDVNMPKMTGIEFLENRPDDKKAVPVVMLTTEGQPALMQRAREMGAKGWIVKPFKPELLLAAIKKLAA